MPEIFGKLFEVRPAAWLTLGIILLISLISFIFLLKKQNTQSIVHTKKLVYGGICIALSFVLSYIRLFQLPQGGSITLASMLPLVLYSLIFGPVAGIVAGVAYGFLQFIQEASIVNIAQLVLDYPLAFACLGLSGIAPKAIKNLYIRVGLATTLAVVARCFMHVLSGVLFFGQYAPEGISPLAYSLVYNGSFLAVEWLITLILSFVIISTPIYSTLKKGAALQVMQ